MKSVEIQGTLRTEVGSKYAQAERKAGNVPCVIYGGEAPVHFSAPALAFKPLVYTPEAKTATITVDGKTVEVVIQDMQFHPVTDQLMHIDMLTNIIVTLDLIWFGSLEMHSLTTVNMHHSEVVVILIVVIAIKILHELGAKLIGKKNTRSNNNNSLRVFCIIKTTHTIFHHDDSLATTSRNIDTTFLRVLESIKSARLVGSKSKRHVFLSMM